MRLTEDLVKKILEQNEGFTKISSYSDRNFRAEYRYIVAGGKLLICEKGRTSWSDSHFDEKRVADIEQTRRFIRKYESLLNLDGI